MTQSGKALLTALVLILLAVLVRADATKRIVLVRAADVALHADPDTTIGRYYTLSYALPGGVTSNRLDRAILELFVNVTVKTRDGFVGASPLLEVYALSEPFSGRFEIDAIDQGRRALRPVALGEGRRVVVDITDIVRAHLEGRVENNGLVLGSLTGMREGEFMFESGRLSGGAVGRLLIFERDGLARAEADAP